MLSFLEKGLTTLVGHYFEYHFVGAVHGVGTDAGKIAYRAVDIVVDDALNRAYASALDREQGREKSC